MSDQEDKVQEVVDVNQEAESTDDVPQAEQPTEDTAPVDNGEIAERITELERERDDYLDRWRRSAAEFQNYKKREERTRIERERGANTRLLLKLLPVLDDLTRAAEHVPEEIQENEWVRGVLSVERKLWNILEQEGVTVIEAQPGTEFDPTVHEALITESSEEIESGQIVNELERGYKLHDTVLRPARVSVAQ